MNYRMIVNIVGKIMILMSILMLLPLGVSLIYYKTEGLDNVLAFVIPIALLLALGFILSNKKKGENKMKTYIKFSFYILSLIDLITLYIQIPVLSSNCLLYFFSKEILLIVLR